ncbi:MAG: hypothetical protein ACE37F_30550 [Nannocystaceae bacterium]|nr:hypothetical protein [bacterium]
MRWMGMLSLLALAGCFSEPPGASSGGSSGAQGEDGTRTSGTSVASSTSDADFSSTGVFTTTGFFESSSTGVPGTTGTDTADTDRPLDTFCSQADNAAAIRCTDFDVERGIEWPELPLVGFRRMIDDDPPASSSPSFVRLSRDPVDDGGGDPLQALYGAEDVLTSGTAGLRVSFAVRFPPSFGEDCGNRPVRVFAAQYEFANDDIVSVTVEVSPDSVRLFYFPNGGGATQHGPFDVLVEEGDAWRRLEVLLRVGPDVVGPSIEIGGADGMSETISLPGFEPPGATVDVNVGPWFPAPDAPPVECSYELDDIVLLPVPLE